ncbi:MAG: PEGA domain-containing protein [Acidobacteria bacterium]|nr:PEGA domain-containing protein [Acidobacteriota bacterium]
MSVFDETPKVPSSRAPLVVGGVAVVLLLIGGAFFLTGREDAAPVATPAPAPVVERPAAPAPTKAEPESAAEPEPAAVEPPRTPARRARAAAPAPAEAPPADAATLTVESDVPGASVFVDRAFVGTAPVTLKNVAPGAKRINLSAEGFEGVQRAVDVAPGENTVTLRFKEVRLSTSVGVSHKHGMGGCDGTLKATIDGLSYQTSNKNDAFTLPYAQIETFEINYLEKNLKVKQRGGKTWNFTDKAAVNADKLFVFHRDVTAARDKLAKGYTAAR